MIQKILALLMLIQEERILEDIYWYVERKVVRRPPRD